MGLREINPDNPDHVCSSNAVNFIQYDILWDWKWWPIVGRVFLLYGAGNHLCESVSIIIILISRTISLGIGARFSPMFWSLRIGNVLYGQAFISNTCFLYQTDRGSLGAMYACVNKYSNPCPLSSRWRWHTANNFLWSQWQLGMFAASTQGMRPWG